MKQNVNVDAGNKMTEYWFYLSCAQADWEPHLERFYHDLSQALSQKLGEPAGKIGYFGINEMKSGDNRNNAIVSALNQSRVFVPLFTPAYFLSDDCSKEWQIFRLRGSTSVTQPGGAPYTALVMPVQWLPARALPTLPTIALLVQHKIWEFGEPYKHSGLRRLMSLDKFRNEYQTFLYKFADKLQASALAHKLPALDNVPSLETLANPFSYSVSPEPEPIKSAKESSRPTEMPVAKTVAATPGSKVCASCGQRAAAADVFCASCGSNQLRPEKTAATTRRRTSESRQLDQTHQSKIFISYRRTDSEGFAGRLFDKLSSHFGEDKIFMDIDTIEPGEDFVNVIEKAVSSCDVLIAVIGRAWLTSTDAEGRRRLDNPEDFVRVEISIALKREIRVIPVLVQGAAIPRSDQLPDVLAILARRNAFELSSSRWKYDVGRLVDLIERILSRQKPAQRADKAEPAAGG